MMKRPEVELRILLMKSCLMSWQLLYSGMLSFSTMKILKMALPFGLVFAILLGGFTIPVLGAEKIETQSGHNIVLTFTRDRSVCGVGPPIYVVFTVVEYRATYWDKDGDGYWDFFLFQEMDFVRFYDVPGGNLIAQTENSFHNAQGLATGPAISLEDNSVGQCLPSTGGYSGLRFLFIFGYTVNADGIQVELHEISTI